jgi:hypothetical protein
MITAASLSPRPSSFYVFLYSAASGFAVLVLRYSQKDWNRQVCVRTDVRVYESQPYCQERHNRRKHPLHFSKAIRRASRLGSTKR